MIPTQGLNATFASPLLRLRGEASHRCFSGVQGGDVQGGDVQGDRPESAYCSMLDWTGEPCFELLEHQVKQIFRDVGIPVPSSQLIANASELKQLGLPYPLILKPQTQRGEQRPRHLTRVTNSIDAMTAAHRLFDRSVSGLYPEYLLVETFSASQNQLGLALSAETQGGLKLQGWRCQNSSCEISNVQTLELESGLSSEATQAQIQALGQWLALEGAQLARVGDIVEKMLILQEWLDLAFLAIDPLMIDGQGEMVVLDGRIRFTAAAIQQQPELYRLFSPKPEVMPPVVKLEGNIGVLSNGMGAALATIDVLKRAGGEPAAFISLKEELGSVARRSRTSQRQKGEQFKQALENLARVKDVKLILVNWESLSASCRDVAKTIVDYFHRAGQHIHLRGLRQPVPLVVCLNGPEAEAGRSLLTDVGIVAVGSVEEAIAEGIGLAKVRRVS